MNDPVKKFGVAATIYWNKSDGTGVRTKIPLDVNFTFADPAPNNARKVDSHKYRSGPDKYLGKRDDPSTLFWERHPDCTSSSPDGYKTKCKVTTITSTGANLGKALTFFKPSGIGGDNYRLNATVFASDGTTKIARKISNKEQVWRKVEFEAYEMSGHRHVSTHGTTAIMAGYYKASTYVKYELKATHLINARYCVKYIGLWDHASTSQKNWNTWKVKKASETPTAAERSAAIGPAGAARNAARTAIKNKAKAWRDRIINQYNNCWKFSN